jgi:hypothetical protein
MITLSICWAAILYIVTYIAIIAFLFFVMHEWFINEETWAKIVGIVISISAFCILFIGVYFALAEIFCN